MKVLLVASDLEYTGSARQLGLLAAGLPPVGCEVKVCVLGPEGPVGRRLRLAGVDVEALGWRHGPGLGALARFGRVVCGFGPAIIHAWRPWAWRASAAAAAWTGRRLLVSQPLGPRAVGPRPGWPTRWLLGRADRVVAGSLAEADAYRRLGVPGTRIALVPPGVEPGHRGQGTGDSRTTRSASEGFIPAPYVLCLGPLEPHKGFRDAIWAFDVLRRAVPELRLLLLGSGPDAPRLGRFVAAIGMEERVRFGGPQEDVGDALAGAAVVWAPGQAGGVGAVLEAMAAGVPVLASRLPGLAEAVADGQTGWLIRPGDKVALARQTLRLLRDEALRRRMGEAGRRRASDLFPAGRMVRDFAELYRELAA